MYNIFLDRFKKPEDFKLKKSEWLHVDNVDTLFELVEANFNNDEIMKSISLDPMMGYTQDEFKFGNLMGTIQSGKNVIDFLIEFSKTNNIKLPEIIFHGVDSFDVIRPLTMLINNSKTLYNL